MSCHMKSENWQELHLMVGELKQDYSEGREISYIKDAFKNYRELYCFY